MKKIKMIPFIDARDLSQEAEDWLVDNDYSTHCQNSVVQLYGENGHDNSFVEWLEQNYDYTFNKKDVNYVAIEST